MTEVGTGISSKVRIATLTLAAFAIFGTGFDYPPAEKPEQKPDRYERRFNTLDKNNDQRLQVDEYIQHAKTKADILRRDFKLFDMDRSKTLTFREFMTTPLVVPIEDRGALPDPLDAFVDHAVAAMDHSFDAWDQHPEREIPLANFARLFASTFGLGSTAPFEFELAQAEAEQAQGDRNGKVNRKEARRFLEIQIGVRRTRGKFIRNPDGRVCNLFLFRRVDANRDERLTQAEFSSQTAIGDQFSGMLKQGDTDKDGRISFNEWCRLPTHGQISPVNDFRRMDKNLDARLDKAELMDSVPPVRKIISTHVFPGFDTDGDGLLSLDEYRMTMQANPCVQWSKPITDTDGDQEITFAEFKFDTPQFPLLRWLYFNRLDLNKDRVLKLNEYTFKTRTPDEFFIVNADGTGWKSLFLFKTHVACGSPAVSPDGKLLAFDAWTVKPRTPSTMFVMETEGSEPRKLDGGSMPSWSHDSTRLVCSSRGVRIIKGDGTHEKVVRENGWGAHWSPNGKTIAFTELNNIRLYDVETKKFHTMSKSHNYRRFFWNMTWSPDNRFLCFKGEKADGTQEVVTVDIRSKKASLKVQHSTQLNINADFAWHPDGNRIAFGMYCPDRKKLQIYELNPNNDAPPTLFPGQDETRNNNDVCWTPDGKQLIVVSGDF